MFSQFNEAKRHWCGSNCGPSEVRDHSGELVSPVEAVFERGEVARYVLCVDGAIGCGKSQWLHITSTFWLTCYRISARCGSLTENITGLVVCGHWKPHYTLAGVLHALYNAHHWRQLQALVEIKRKDRVRRMQTLLRRACHAANLARQRGRPIPPRLIALIERFYDRIVADGMEFQAAQSALTRTVDQARCHGHALRRVGHNLLLRLSTRKPDVLRFLSNAALPFTNYLAERNGRVMKQRQKISCGFCAITGAEDFAVIRSLLSTVKKQQWHVLQALNACPNTLITQLQFA